MHGGFSQEMGIIMCENNNYTSRRMESTLAHEMVHAFDHCRFKFDHGNLKHVACAEVTLVWRYKVLSVGEGSSIIEGMSVFG